jgi:hypothetical protein
VADIQAMTGKEVEVIANGMKYTGVLIEVSDTEVHLKGSYQWISLPVSSVGEIRLKETVGRSLYQEPETEQQKPE